MKSVCVCVCVCVCEVLLATVFSLRMSLFKDLKDGINIDDGMFLTRLTTIIKIKENYR